jgi:class 3 adenylate cyclase
MTQTRRLAAILAADVAGYSRLIGDDEEGTLNRLRSIRAEVIDPKITENRGRIVKTTGDGLLVEFSSVVDALRCATEWQRGMDERNAAAPEGHRIEFRIGVHQGDIVVEDNDIFGDGVNVGARLEGLAEPGGICASARVQEDVAGRLDLTFEDMGEQALKNIARPVRVYQVRNATAKNFSAFTPSALPLPDKPSIAASSRRYPQPLPILSASSACSAKLRRANGASGEPSHQSRARKPPDFPDAAHATPVRSMTVALTPRQLRK